MPGLNFTYIFTVPGQGIVTTPAGNFTTMALDVRLDNGLKFSQRTCYLDEDIGPVSISSPEQP